MVFSVIFNVRLHRKDFSRSIKWLWACSTSTWEIRNIGIIAHIDAGKTTTTERMLYYGGFTKQIGNVDDGSTVTDFLASERERGITVQSAAVTFHWPRESFASRAKNINCVTDQRTNPLNFQINLIDTPGHADFNFEVVRSLRVLDGAVCILDAVAGVEAQTEQVWRQASNYGIPRIIYVNKMDRTGASFSTSLRQIAARLNVRPAICQIPWYSSISRKFIGVADVISLNALQWLESTDGSLVKSIPLSDLFEYDNFMADEMVRARKALVELLTDYDDTLVETFFNLNQDYLAIFAHDIWRSLRKCTLHERQSLVAIFCGASYRNIGVQPLLDAIVELLPSPLERCDIPLRIGEQQAKLTVNSTGICLNTDQLANVSTKLPKLSCCLLAFKAVHDPHRGMLVFVRIYSGSLKRHTLLYNTKSRRWEKVTRLLRVNASRTLDCDEMQYGEIGAIEGLQYTETGDTLICPVGFGRMSGRTRDDTMKPVRDLSLLPISTPPAAFYASIQPKSLADEKFMNQTLKILSQEDPSLRIMNDQESGYTQIAGMGHLHLEIALDRLIREFKANVSVGPIEIAYRESINHDETEFTEYFAQRVFRDHSHQITSRIRLKSNSALPTSHHHETMQNVVSESISLTDNNSLCLHFEPISGELNDNLPDIYQRRIFPFPWETVLNSYRQGIQAALSRGPNYSYPVHSVRVDIFTSQGVFGYNAGIDPTQLTCLIRDITSKALMSAFNKNNIIILEPVMKVVLTLPESDLGTVMHDISSGRGGLILSLDGEDSNQTVVDVTKSGEPLKGKNIYTPNDRFGSSLLNHDVNGSRGFTVDSSSNSFRCLIAGIPLREMVDYSTQLRSLTHGRGSYLMSFYKFQPVSRNTKLTSRRTMLPGSMFHEVLV